MTKIIFPSGNAYSDDGSAERDMLDGGHTEYLLPMLGETIGAAQMALDAVPEARQHASEAATARDGAQAERDAAAVEHAGARDEHAGAAAERAEAARSAAAARADAASVHMPALAGKAGRVLGVSVDESAMEWTDLSPLAKLGDLASPDKGAALIGFKPSSRSSVARTVADELNDSYANPKRYGAKGNGSAEDTVAIQTAIDELAAAGGGVVRFPKGNYPCNVVLKQGVTLEGGTGSFGYLPDASLGRMANVILSQANPGFVVDTPASRIRVCAIQGIAFNGLGANYPGGGVRYRNTVWSSIKRCSANNFADQGFLEAAGVGTVLEDILTTNVLLNRARTQVSGAVEMRGFDYFLNRLEVNPSLTSVYSPDLFIAGIYVGGANAFISNVVGEDAERGIYVAPLNGAGHRFSNARADSNVGPGFYVDGNALFSTCFAYNNSMYSDGVYSGWYMSKSSTGCVLTACGSSGRDASNRQKYGYEDYVNNSIPNVRNSYMGCVGAYYSAGLYLTQGFLGSGVISPPQAIRPADGTSIIDVTGTSLVVLDSYVTATNVTNFTGSAEGLSIRVKGNARVTIVPGSGIITSTGANVALVTNKMYSFTQYNGNWFMD